MQITDLRNPSHKIISRPHNSMYQFVRFVDVDNANQILDLSAYNMYLTVRDADFLDKINQFWHKDIKLQRIARDPSGNIMQPIDSGIYLNYNTGAGNQPNGGDFKLIINQFPSTLFPVGVYYLDWVIQYIDGQTDVLFTLIWEVTNVLPDPAVVDETPFVKIGVSLLSPPMIQIGIKMIQTPQ
jgi:hypothetical protein